MMKAILCLYRHLCKLIAIILVFNLFSASGFSQESKLKTKMNQDKIIDLDFQRNKNFKELSILLEKRKFVFEAEFKQEQNKLKEPVSSVFDFIIVDSSSFIMKMYNEYEPHVTNLGGIITGWELTKNESRFSYSLNFKVVSVRKFNEMYITINIDSDYLAKAYVLSNNFFGINIRYDGRIKKIED